jgi:hypothetical protein
MKVILVTSCRVCPHYRQENGYNHGHCWKINSDESREIINEPSKIDSRCPLIDRKDLPQIGFYK